MTTIETPVLIVGGGGLTATAVSKLGVAEAIYRRGTPAANMSHTAYFAGFAGLDPV